MSIRRQMAMVLCIAAIQFVFFNTLSFAAEKEDFPKKQIKIISLWPGGGGGDQEARGISLYLKKYVPVPVIIENVPGAGTKIGLTKAWKSEPDGYTLVYITPPQPILNEYMSPTEYKTKEFTPVYGFFKRSCALTVNADNWKTVEELANAGKTKTLSIGLSSFGSAAHLCALGTAKAWGINAHWVPYETGTDAVAQVAGKHLDAAVTMASTALPLARAGKVRGLMVYSDKRLEGFETVPTPAEAGYPIPIIGGLAGFVAPPKTPAHVVRILEEAFEKVSRDPEFLAWAARATYDVSRLTSDEFRQRLLEEYKIVEENMPAVRASMSSK